jgi:hypothetical protein
VIMYRCHKIILAAASDLFNSVFTDHDPKIIINVRD